MSDSFEIDTDAVKQTSGLWNELGSGVQAAWGRLMDAQNTALAGGAFSDGDTGRQVYSQLEGAEEKVEPAVTGAAESMISTGQGLVTMADGFASTEEGLTSGLDRNGFGPKGTDV